MTSPTRLLDSAQNPNARALLRAGLEEGPKPGALRATALALGVTASLALTAPATAMLAPSLALVTAKWVAVGTLAGVALAGGVNALTTPVALPSHLPAPIPSVPREVPMAPPVVPERSAVPAATVEPAPPVVARASLPVAPLPVAPTDALPQTSSPPERSDLAAEVAKIDAARRALSSGDAAAALAQLEQYHARVRTGTLDREAQLLRIDALLGAGQRAGALQLAEQYLGRFPQDPHAARLRALVGDRSGAAQTRPE